jgi:cardiolipin synthase
MTLSDQFWEPLLEAGGTFRWFNPIQLRSCGFRNHRKLLVCDEEIAFVGGFNISTEYQGDGVHSGWHDRGLQVGPALAGELARSFDQLFALAEFRHKPFTVFRKARVRNIIATDAGQLLLGGPGRGRNQWVRLLLKDLAAAKAARLVCAYFLPTRPVRVALIRLARRGAPVQMILPGKTDVPLVQLAGRRFYSALLKAGVEIYEYQPQVLHDKLFLIGKAVYFGSANLDRRSFSINYELLLRLTDPRLVAEARELFDRQAWGSTRTLWTRLMESCAFFILARLDPYLARRQMKTVAQQRLTVDAPRESR